jgi:16S rRNA (guanine966-N2)-methyltransferase
MARCASAWTSSQPARLANPVDVPRVISGAARGRHLRTTGQTRPTADLIKGAIFLMLGALAYKRGFEPDERGDFAAALAWPRVLDLFAGSGALGIEALSRGARSADFVEQNRDAVAALQANLRLTRFDGVARVHHLAVNLALRRLHGPFDLVFADPPYADASLLKKTVTGLADHDLLLPTSVVVLEHAADTEPPAPVGAFTLANSRHHGATRISLYST